MNSDSIPEDPFICFRQRPTNRPDETEDLGPVTFRQFVDIFREIDWRKEVLQAEWIKKADPTVAVTNKGDDCTFWVSAILAGSIIDVEAETDERYRIDRLEPWFSAGLANPPEIELVTSFELPAQAGNCGFATASGEVIEECFEWFFQGDYQSLYQRFRWT